MLKHRLLALTALVAFCNAGTAVAFDPRTQGTASPDVEVNNSVLNKLTQSPSPVASAPAATPATSATPLPSSAKNFLSEEPVKAVKPVHKKKKHKAKSKAVTPASAKPVAKVDTAPEVKVVGNNNTDNVPELVAIPDHGAKSAVVPAPTPTPTVPAPVVKSETVTVPAPAVSIPVPSVTPAVPTPSAPVPSVATPLPASSSALPPLPGNSAPSLPGSAPETNALPPLPSSGSATDLPPLPGDKTVPAPAAGLTPKNAAASAVALAPDSLGDTEAKPDMRIVFNEAETEVPLSETPRLDVFVQQLSQSSTARVSIVAYSSGSDASAGVDLSKRVSLKRGIAIRNYIVGRNIDVERITVKAQGNKATTGPGNRVDLFIIK